MGYRESERVEMRGSKERRSIGSVGRRIVEVRGNYEG